VVAEQFGGDLKLWVYNRDVLPDGEMPPLNTEEGEKWLLKEIEAVKPDMIVFDSIMSLTLGPMSDEESWAPINLLMRKITSMRIAQIWLHHTGHDKTRGFGTKTREWQVDTVAILLAADDEAQDEAIELRFTKKRLATPKTFKQFEPKIIRCGPDGWEIVGEVERRKGRPASGDKEILRRAMLQFYDQLADAATPSAGFDGARVLKVKIDDLRDLMKRRGHLQTTDTGGLTSGARSLFHRVKGELLTRKVFVEQDGLIWKIDHGPRL
jgi:hypothetical protein